jgi:acyl-CoA thioesterase I
MNQELGLRLLKRVFVTVALVALVFGSLIGFPSHLHWWAAIWIAIALIASVRNRPAWPWLISCALIIAIKRPGFTLELWELEFGLIGIAFVDWRGLERFLKADKSKRLVLYAVVLVTSVSVFGLTRWFASNTSVKRSLDGRPIACLGDSLTDCGYPQELAKLISVPVTDFGVNGIKTDDGIKMIPDILAADPQLVVIELGGHDYNADHKPRSATKANLVSLIEAFRERDIAVILVEIPRGFVSDPYDGLERELASRFDLQLIDDSVIRSFVFFSPIVPPGSWLDPARHYSNDGLHPNKAGNRHLAQVAAHSLVRIFGDAILK